ncbi:tetratricopeptide repeat protein [Edaphobacter aggregans]|uniref:Tetratricopeptide repeat protein n=1 Tax=Edaphobacter aggregans TaxID=570835 RepID=A0A3R9NVW5_9BACT|nr:tetratricopeptide repeat protein [Edaphobacter aggregans]RSL18024.1 tetratricopeptide repeat protein [Edaphobacter aggregans]
MGTYYRSSLVLILFSLLTVNALASAQNTQKDTLNRDVILQEAHKDPQWLSIQAHLPDPTTATAAQLEMAADVLRARRFPEDAIVYYGYALQRGGDAPQLLNKMGVAELELRHPAQARAYFQRVVKIKKKNPEGWNNLGALEYMEGRYNAAISDYSRAIKLDKTSATFHSNLGTAYFDKKEFESARKEYDIALKLDPGMLQHHGTAGVTTRMLSPEDHARFCYELARLYAQRGDEEDMLRYLTMASEGGFDILTEMGGDSLLGQYRKDPRILLIVTNAKALRGNHLAQASGVPPPPLPPPVHE